MTSAIRDERHPLRFRIRKLNPEYTNILNLGAGTLSELLGEHYPTIMALRPIIPHPISNPMTTSEAPGPQAASNPAASTANHQRPSTSAPGPGRLTTAVIEPVEPGGQGSVPSEAYLSSGSGVNIFSIPNIGEFTRHPQTQNPAASQNNLSPLPSIQTSVPPHLLLPQMGRPWIPEIPQLEEVSVADNGSPDRLESLPLGPVSGNIIGRTLPSPKRNHSTAFGEGNENGTGSITFDQMQTRRLGFDISVQSMSAAPVFASLTSSVSAGPSLPSIAE